MNKRNADKPPPVIEIFLEDTSGRELKRNIARRFPGCQVRTRTLHGRVMYRFAGGPGEALELAHDVFVFISAHKKELVGPGLYLAGKALDIIAELAKD